MARLSLRLTLLLASLVAAGEVFAQVARPRLIDQAAAARHGLTRLWFGHVPVGGGRSPIVDVKFDAGTLFVQTKIGTVHAIDGETGRTIWTAEVGSPRHPSMPIGLSESRVAVLNGTTLYVLSRSTGQLEFSKTMRGVPIAGAALSEEAAFVPNTSGQIETHSLIEEDHRNLANLRLEGQELTQPAVSYVGVVAASGRGDIGLANLAGTELIFRLPTNNGFRAAPAAWGSRFYAGNVGGLLYAFEGVGGSEKWSFAAGSAITQSPAPFADAVYVLCEDLTMYRVSTETGREEWMAKNIRRFLAKSPTKVYTLDRFGRLATLSAKSGALIDLAAIPPLAFPVTNTDTDQIFLATDTGLIQCLRELELTKRLDYRPPKKEAPEKIDLSKPKPGAKPALKTPPPAQPPADATPVQPPPAAKPPMPATPVDDPFGPAEVKPAEVGDPFGGQ
jgi:outer membrane protein assembly factor BamB